MINMTFTKIPAWVVDMQSDLNSPAYMPLMLQELIDLYEAATKLKIEINDDYMTLTTNFIYKNLGRSLNDYTIKGLIRYLYSIDLIDYKTDYRNLYIKINFDKIAEMKQKYYREDYNLKFFIVYHFVVAYTAVEAPKSAFAYILASLILHEASEGKLSREMSVEYIHAKFNKQFTYKQEKTAKSKLIKDGIMTEEVKTYRNDNGKVYKRCFFTVNENKVNELITKHTEKNIVECEEYVVEKYQTCNFKTSKTNGIYTTKDKLRSGSYTQEEKDEFKRQAEALTAAGEQWIF